MIKIEHLRKEYENITPLKDVNVTINKGDVISIIGPSGTGKSTLIRCINMLEEPTSGHIYYKDVDLTDKKTNLSQMRTKIQMVFQSFNLFNHLTIVENITLAPITLLKMDKQEAYDNALRLLQQVGLKEKAFNYPDELSGGQKQRIAIARALAMNPEVILFDEPTSALDPLMVGEVQNVILDLAKTGITMMIVTHEMNFAKQVANRVFFMNDGGVYEEGTPEDIFGNPKKEKTIEFIKKLKVLEIDFRKGDMDFATINNKANDFALRNRLSEEQTMHIQNLVNNYMTKHILNITHNNSEICIKLEYDPELKKLKGSVRFSGPEINAIADARPENIEKYNMRYEYVADDELPNKVTLSM